MTTAMTAGSNHHSNIHSRHFYHGNHNNSKQPPRKSSSSNVPSTTKQRFLIVFLFGITLRELWMCWNLVLHITNTNENNNNSHSMWSSYNNMNMVLISSMSNNNNDHAPSKTATTTKTFTTTSLIPSSLELWRSSTKTARDDHDKNNNDDNFDEKEDDLWEFFHAYDKHHQDNNHDNGDDDDNDDDDNNDDNYNTSDDDELLDFLGDDEDEDDSNHWETTTTTMMTRSPSVFTTQPAHHENNNNNYEEEEEAVVEGASIEFLQSRRDGPDFAHCYYRDFAKYHRQQRQQQQRRRRKILSLPDHVAAAAAAPPIMASMDDEVHLIEIFASFDRTTVFLVAQSGYGCQKDARSQWKNVTFDCIFEHPHPDDDAGAMMTTTSLPLPFLAPRHAYILIVCPVPTELQPTLPTSGQAQTRAFLTLREKPPTTNNATLPPPENENPPRPPRQLSHLPICSHAWPAEVEEPSMGRPSTPLTTTQPVAQSLSDHRRDDGNPNNQQKKKPKYRIAVMTRVALTYQRGLDLEELSVSPWDLITWMEYHAALGVEHFYIYDDSPHAHNSTIRQWCTPYIQSGLVTYVQYPLDDMHCNVGNRPVLYSGQRISTNAALRRYETETEWMGHWDIDEYLVLRMPPKQFFYDSANKTRTMLDAFLDQQLENRPVFYDEISILRFPFGVCSGGDGDDDHDKNNTTMANSTTKKEDSQPKDASSGGAAADHHPITTPYWHVQRKGCFLPEKQNTKGLYKTFTVKLFGVHTSVRRMDEQKTRKLRLPHSLGVFAHFRDGKAGGTYFPYQTGYFDAWKDIVLNQIAHKSFPTTTTTNNHTTAMMETTRTT